VAGASRARGVPRARAKGKRADALDLNTERRARGRRVEGVRSRQCAVNDRAVT
jgi:hypothetical protein